MKENSLFALRKRGKNTPQLGQHSGNQNVGDNHENLF